MLALTRIFKVDRRCSGNATKEAASLETTLNTCRAMASILEASAQRPSSVNRRTIEKQLKKLLESTPMIFGIWAAFEPDALDGRDSYYAGKRRKRYGNQGRFSRYFWRRSLSRELSPEPYLFLSYTPSFFQTCSENPDKLL